MASGSGAGQGFVAPDGTLLQPQAYAQGAAPLVSTIQSVKSPIWSVPVMSEGQLNVGVSSGLEVATHDLQTVAGMQEFPPSAPKRVVVKQIVPRPPTQSASPTKAPVLTQLVSNLTPQQAQTILKTLSASQQQQQPHAAPSLPTPTQPTTVAPPPRQSSRGKTLAPRHHGRSSGGSRSTGGHVSRPLVPGTVVMGPSHVVQSSQLTPLQKVVAPVAIPPTGSTPSTSLPLSPDPPSLPHDHSNMAPPTQPVITTSKPRKPCNCKNSQCLKLYCDCFANGEFCRDACNCQNCKNNMCHAEERAKAVKTCLDRNPHAFKPKVGQRKAGDERRHIKGCNCKRSGCLKNYCECYEAKIPCSALCRCVGCKNLPDKPEHKSLMQLADAADIRTQQQRAATSHFLEKLELTTAKPQATTQDGQRLPFSFINKEVAKATCLCLLEEASHAQMNGKSPKEVERTVLEEFGRCMTQIINSAQTASGGGPTKPMTVH